MFVAGPVIFTTPVVWKEPVTAVVELNVALPENWDVELTIKLPPWTTALSLLTIKVLGTFRATLSPMIWDPIELVPITARLPNTDILGELTVEPVPWINTFVIDEKVRDDILLFSPTTNIFWDGSDELISEYEADIETEYGEDIVLLLPNK